MRLIVGVIVAAMAWRAAGEFAVPPEAPVERLAANLAAHVKANPKDAMGHYTLGRIHHLAFELRTTTLRAWEREGRLPSVPGMFNRRLEERGARPAPDEKELLEHLRQALASYRAAIALEQENGLFHLGLASLLEAGAAAGRGGLKLPDLPWVERDEEPDWKVVYRDEAIAHYSKAFDLAIAGDLKLEHRPLEGLEVLVSYEAGKQLAKLIKERGAQDDAGKARLAEVEKAVAQLEKIPWGAITPVIFSFDGAERLDELVDPDVRVRFDLDGTGRGQAWPWVRPGTAILVWDPKGTGKVESGRQLFGSVTFWMFWRDGYEALAALDDDGDGELSGSELDGIAVWRDADQDGVSDAGEVVPAASAGVEGIAVRWSDREGRSPMNRAGVRLRGGRVVGSWDWVVGEAKP